MLIIDILIDKILRFPYLVYGKEDYDYRNKKDLIALGYGTSFSADIIRKAKKLMIEKGILITNPVNWTEYPKKPWKNY